MREDATTAEDWARLGNALTLFAVEDSRSVFRSSGVLRAEAVLYAAAAFYYGGFPASAYLTARTQTTPQPGAGDFTTACFDFLARPEDMASDLGKALQEALRTGHIQQIEALARQAAADAQAALAKGPDHWIPARLAEELVRRFVRTNLRAVLPSGGSDFWTPLVESFLNRAVWEFFPSQIAAIEQGILDSSETFSLQMPTGSGKTALCETLLYRHAKATVDEVAVLLVPYRSLASELRGSVVKRLNSMEIAARCAYGGTVPTGAEVHSLAAARVLVATPEALSGVLSADPSFYRRISLVVCDEGHLLDSPGRGVFFELLLARFRSREDGPPRFVFVSAIVPNIEEINSWLRGRDASVVRSDYRPAIAEFAVLRPSGKAAAASVALEINPLKGPRLRFSIPQFLRRADFFWWNAATKKRRTYNATTVKARAIATARKVLPMGPVAVFAANKRGNQGAIGLADELLAQVDCGLPLPKPSDYITRNKVRLATEYVKQEYGSDWIGTRALTVGAIVHHGDVPQETREVLETLVREADVRFAICTATLAEGVNLPLRTIVLYSVQRRGPSGQAEDLLVRDIKNLVGRAGRAGSTTKALVICANPKQWSIVAPAARLVREERVTGALHRLIEGLVRFLAARNAALSNGVLERSPVLHPLTDGVDAILVDLLSEEMGEDEFVRQAIGVADDTFALHQGPEERSRKLLHDVFEMRARRISAIAARGRIAWIRETGARVRMLDVVEEELLPRRVSWNDVTDPLESGFVDTLLEWAWGQPDLKAAVRKAYRLKPRHDTDDVQAQFFSFVRLWLAGKSFVVIGRRVSMPIDDVLGVHAGVVTFVLQVLVEQAVAVLDRLVEIRGESVSEPVRLFPEHLRFGVPTEGARVLAVHGVRHRVATVQIGRVVTELGVVDDRATLFRGVRSLLADDPGAWEARLGTLVFRQTLQDVS